MPASNRFPIKPPVAELCSLLTFPSLTLAVPPGNIGGLCLGREGNALGSGRGMVPVPAAPRLPPAPGVRLIDGSMGIVWETHAGSCQKTSLL